MSTEVLLVEDSPGDVRLTREAFRVANKSIHLHVASDGVEAMAFLRRKASILMHLARISFCWISICPKWMAGKCSLLS